jgi:ABC-2 type transport system permease protein
LTYPRTFYALRVETILQRLFDDIDRWLPGQLLTALAVGGSDTDHLPALGALAVYATVTAGLALRAFERADVTA